ncbi:MAG: ABC transporter substrate-binding protein [Clostridia bacterium]|nr:ABC transporter substrate-binding protein [Clostridia bacterium]
MKKLIILILAAVMLLSLVSCDPKTQNDSSAPAAESSGSAESAEESKEASVPAEKTDIRVAGLKGPTSIGMVKLMRDAEDGNAANNYEFTVAGSADEVTPKLIKGEFDIAAIPANLAAVLYNNTDGEIRIIAINTLGVLYIVEKGGEVAKLEDLKGKTIYATGKGSTPEYTLRHILEKNGIDPDKDVTIDFKSEPSEVVPLLKKAEKAVAMLPQPYVTVASANVEGLNTVIDLNAEWGKVESDTGIITGVTVVRKAFADEHPEAVKEFLKEYGASVEYVNANVEDAAALVEKYGIVAAAVAKKAIPQCNITFISGNEMKTPLSVYLGVLYEANAKSVGGKLPGDDICLVLE